MELRSLVFYFGFAGVLHVATEEPSPETYFQANASHLLFDGQCACSPLLQARAAVASQWLRLGELDPASATQICGDGSVVTNGDGDCCHGKLLVSLACLQMTALWDDAALEDAISWTMMLAHSAFGACQAEVMKDDYPVFASEIMYNYYVYKQCPQSWCYRLQKLPFPRLTLPIPTSFSSAAAQDAARLEELAIRWGWDNFRADGDRGGYCIGGDFHCEDYGHCYVPQFVRALPFAATSVERVLELGVCAGNSLGMWTEFFPNAQIVGADLRNESLTNAWPRLADRLGSELARVSFIQANYTSPLFLKELSAHGPFDLIIDDGSHDEDAMYMAYSLLFFAPHGLKPGGLYAILDFRDAARASQMAKFKTVLDLMYAGTYNRGRTKPDEYLRLVSAYKDQLSRCGQY